MIKSNEIFIIYLTKINNICIDIFTTKLREIIALCFICLHFTLFINEMYFIINAIYIMYLCLLFLNFNIQIYIQPINLILGFA